MFSIIMIILCCISLFFILENIIHNTKMRALKMLIRNPLAFLYNVLTMFFLYSIIFLLLNNIVLSYLALSIISISLGLLNYQLQFYRNEFFKPLDIKLFKESMEISENIEFKIPKSMYNSVAILITYVLILILNNNIIFYRINIIIPIFIIFLLLIQNDNFCQKILHIKIDNFSDFADYENNGFMFTFLRNLHTFKLQIPKGYRKGISKEKLKNIKTTNPSKKPNIIIIMNESFFNINEISALKLSKNPLETFEEIKSTFTNGNVISPVIGGGTCQPEYEMLTGNSVFFTNKFKIAFLEFFKSTNENISGLPKILKDLSYSSLFIHPYKKQFYNREKAYTSLGFDKILDIKNFTTKNCPRVFVSDLDCYKLCINEFEKKDADTPFFSVIVTMQNHPGYLSGEKYNKHDINVLNTNISSDEKTMLENYVNLLKESDDAIKYFTDFFADKDDTTILFFGDHQPSDNIGFSTITKRNELELSRTPFFIWNNFGLPKKDYNDISSCYLSPILLNEVDIKTDKYFNYLYEKLKVLKAFNTGFVINSDNVYIKRENCSDEILSLLQEFELIQFDRIKHNTETLPNT